MFKIVDVLRLLAAPGCLGFGVDDSSARADRRAHMWAVDHLPAAALRARGVLLLAIQR